MNNIGLGAVRKGDNADRLFRLALRAFIRNDNGEILVVKEVGHDWWDLPGGGLGYDETIKECLARELKEEVGLVGDFSFRVIATEEPVWNERAKVMQINILFEVLPDNTTFSSGDDGVEVAFIPSEELYKSNIADSHIAAHLNYALSFYS